MIYAIYVARFQNKGRATHWAASQDVLSKTKAHETCSLARRESSHHKHALVQNIGFKIAVTSFQF